ncbi:RNA-directed DNA polymerase [Nocardia amamiensis]|uniref:RNA-directed DNA polymerase n=1 Tax=Nocardia amamiensis TaxID=404578 RepID=UPI001470F0D8|nr:reverse transcriptase domain-containing protein [Nocardia amamiensis]
MDRKVLDLVNIGDAARLVARSTMDRFPPLISDQCLSGDPALLARFTESHWSESTFSISETLTMPKGRFGTRPIDVVPCSTRSAYHALAAALKPELPAETRTTEWQDHRRFGSEYTGGYLIDMDVASCYEYIDHDVLRGEILLHSCNATLSGAIVSLVGSFMPRSRGLPQMLWPSDLLADAYLSVIDRYLDRRDIPSHRYADDIRMVISDWGMANQIVEDVADQLRTIGLIPSEGKTRILKAENIGEPESEDQNFLTKNFPSRVSTLRFDSFLTRGPYGSVITSRREVDTTSESDPRSDNEVASRIIANDRGLKLDGPMKWLTIQALASLRSGAERLSDKSLLDLLHRDQGMAEHVCQYLIARSKVSSESLENQWKTLHELTNTERQSPWTKIWIITVVQATPVADLLHRSRVIDWLIRQLQDRHETVRAQAAWALATHNALASDVFERVYILSSSLTRHGLAAAASKQGGVNVNISRAVQNDSPLNKSAWQWAQA